MDCATVSCIGDDEVCYSRHKISSNCEVECEECKGKIKSGEIFWHHETREDEASEDPDSTEDVCMDCQSVINNLFDDGWYTGMIWEMLGDHLSDCDGEISMVAVSKLTPPARDKVCDMIESFWAE